MISHYPSLKCNIKYNGGFTMMEIIAVLVVLAIITAVTVSRYAGTNDVNAQAEMDAFKGHLRFVQYRAMNDVAPVKWGIQVNEQSYTVVRNPALAENEHFYLPGESSETHQFPSGITASVAGSNPIMFDDWGSPGNSDTTVTVGGKNTTVTANTGFIP